MEFKLLNLPTTEIYKDLFQPGMKNVGEALSTVLETATLTLFPLRLLNEKSKIYFEANIKRYNEKLNAKDLTLTQVPPYIGLPIIDKLSYIDRNELSEAFINLLTKASFEETSNLLHPTFITILNNLSSDEAKILLFYHKEERIPYVELYIHKYTEAVKEPESKKGIENIKKLIDYSFQDRADTYIEYAKYLTGIENEVELIFPENINLYIDNLLHNGLIYLERTVINKNDLEKYDDLLNTNYLSIKNTLDEQLLELNKKYETDNIKLEIQIRRESIKFTELGKKFIQACIVE